MQRTPECESAEVKWNLRQPKGERTTERKNKKRKDRKERGISVNEEENISGTQCRARP
jgi:hypothetical protein